MVHQGVLHARQVFLAALNLSCGHLQALCIWNLHANAALDTVRNHLTQEIQSFALPYRATHVVIYAMEEQAGKTLEPLDTHAVSQTDHLAYPLIHRRLSTQTLQALKDFFARRIVEFPSHVQAARHQGEDVLLAKLEDALDFSEWVLYQDACTLIAREVPGTVDETRLDRVSLAKPSKPPPHLENLTGLWKSHLEVTFPNSRHPQALEHLRQDHELLILRKTSKVKIITEE